MDHEALKWLLKMTKVSGSLTHRGLRLLELDFDVVHRRGGKHQAANALSRLKTNAVDTKTMEDVFSVMEIFDKGQTENGS